MKKLFYLVFISSVALASCTKEVTCDCTVSSNGTGTTTSSFNCNSALLGLWKTGPGISSTWSFYISESGDGYHYYETSTGVWYSYSGNYSCTGSSLLSFVETYDDTPRCFSGNYSITGDTMIYEVIGGYYEGSTFTLYKQ